MINVPDSIAFRVSALSKAEHEIRLIRAVLGLSQLHDPVEAVRILYTDGRAAFEAARDDKREG